MALITITFDTLTNVSACPHSILSTSNFTTSLLYGALTDAGQLYCNSTWDTVSCWPTTPAGHLAVLACPPKFEDVLLDPNGEYPTVCTSLECYMHANIALTVYRGSRQLAPCVITLLQSRKYHSKAPALTNLRVPFVK